MKLSTYQEGLLKKITSVERRKITRSILKDKEKIVSRYEMFLEKYPHIRESPNAREVCLSTIRSAQKEILEIEQRLDDLN